MAMFDDVEEHEANYFAICLLMPRRFVEQKVREMGGFDIVDEKAVRALAKKFGVSAPLMAFRLGQLWRQ